MAKLYDDVFKDDGGDEMERIEKARDEVEELARERVQKGIDETVQQARVAVYRNNPTLVDQLLGAPPPEPEQKPESSPARREVESEVLSAAAILADKTPGLSLTEAALRVLRTDSALAARYFDN